MSTLTNTIYGRAKFSYLSDGDEAFGKIKYHVVLEVSKRMPRNILRLLRK